MKQIWIGYKTAGDGRTEAVCAFDDYGVATRWYTAMNFNEANHSSVFVGGAMPLIQKTAWRRFVDWCYAENKPEPKEASK
jgi:hypothetical protein